MKTKLIQLFVLVLLTGCVGSSKFPKQEGEVWKPRYQMQAGLNHGGITENNDFTLTPEVQPDGFSGATRMGTNVGVHMQLPIRKNALELGLDYMYSGQTFTYNDPLRAYFGTRELANSQILLPFTYNIGLFRKSYYQSWLSLKLGYVFMYNLVGVQDKGQLPEYSINYFARGISVGLQSTPYRLSNGASLGLFVDVYRGGKVYDDFYNREIYKMPGSSYAKFGLVYQFK